MRTFLINKNLSFYFWLKKRIGKRRAFWVGQTPVRRVSLPLEEKAWITEYDSL
jgi:hypothetical protein